MWKLVVMYVLLIPGVAMFIGDKYKLGGDAPRTVALKAACTTVIVLAAVAGMAGAPEQAHIYTVWVTCGLVFGLVGDIVICQKLPESGFVSGMLFFALGHLCYIAAFLYVSQHPLWAAPVFAVIYLLLLFLVHKLDLSLGKMLIPTAVYAAIITAMVSLSVTMPFSAANGFLLPVGAGLFAVSDAILAYGVYGKINGKMLDSFGLYCYFIGQSLFAVSIYCLY